MIPGVVGAARNRVKNLYFPGKGIPDNVTGDPARIGLNTVQIDQWYPQSGLGPGWDQVPASGHYMVQYWADFPATSYPGVGFGNTWSGTGWVILWVRQTRGGAIIQDNLGYIDSGELGGSDTDLNTISAGFVIYNMERGDAIEWWISGGATGHGPKPWNANLIMTKLRI